MLGVQVYSALNLPMVCEKPERVVQSAWVEHIPFAFFVIECHKPALLVELGVERGVSYCAFCQAVHSLGLPTKCFGVDTWAGDAHTGPYDEEIFQELAEYNAKHYSDFSSLLRMPFDNAVDSFGDGTIDLLHIDGYHTYDAVKHDFETWLPKMSDRCVVLLHDTFVRDRGFGVWSLLAELRQRYPVFEFTHGYGLGVVGVGSALTVDRKEPLMQLLAASKREARSIRRFFVRAGSKISAESSLIECKSWLSNLRSLRLWRCLATSRMIVLGHKAFELLRQRKYGELRQKILTELQGECQTVWKGIWEATWAKLDSRILSRFRSTQNVIVQVLPGTQTISIDENFRLALFAHHDPDGLVDDYVIYELSRLTELPTKIVFVSTADHLSSESIDKIRPFCHTIILRKNVGWDFGSWKAAMDLCPSLVERAETLILMNDSCYGPFGSLPEIVESLESKRDCLTGITASHEMAYHIQSYFMVFPPSVLRSDFFSEFRKNLKYLSSKRKVIERYEVGTSILARRHGLTLHSWVPEESLLSPRAPLGPRCSNPTLSAWRALLFQGLSPFLKRSLFSVSRGHLGDEEQALWEYLNDRTEYPSALIENHLFRTGVPVGKISDWGVYRKALEGLRGIEVGGPSDSFRSGSFLPVYDVVGELDGVNFSDVTVWQGDLSALDNYTWHPDRPPGRLFIAEGTNLASILDEEYDFVLACHVLEHAANPLKALEEWLRILKPGGVMLLVLPRKEFTFDHRRAVTSFDHLLADHANHIGEDDLTHLEEILELHDLVRDPQAGNRDAFRRRSRDNFRNRCLHQHVFDLQLAADCLKHFGLEVISTRLVAPFHQILLAKK